MEQIMNYVKPELIVVAIVLYFCGMALKQTQMDKDKYIPMLLGAGGIVLCGIWVLATSPLGNGPGDCYGGLYSDCSGNFNGGSQ